MKFLLYLSVLGSFACSEYNIGNETDKVLGNDTATGSDSAEPSSEPSVDSGTSVDTGFTDSNNEASTEPSSEPSMDSGNPTSEPTSEPSSSPSTDPIDTGGPTGPVEPSSEPDNGYDPNNAGPVSQAGNVVTILMALSDQWIPEAIASQLIINAVDFVSTVSNPHVLVIRDDNTNGEDEDDPLNFTGWLQNAGFNVDFMEEPSNGISVSTLSGYHVVIFSNPGYPPDDNNTIDALYTFSQQGYGVIVQGDDMTRTSNPNMEALTRLVGVDNGGNYYGVQIDNNAGAAYEVSMVAGNVLNTGISTSSFNYGNDIDTTTLASTGIYVAAWATVENSSHPLKPVITAFSPYQTVFQ